MEWPTLATSRLRERDARQAERADVSKSNQQKTGNGLWDYLEMVGKSLF